MKLLVRWVIIAIAIFVAARVVPGIDLHADDSSALAMYVVMAAVLALVNAFIRPILMFLTCPLQLLTLGLGAIVVNAVCFWFAGWLAETYLEVPFRVDGFLAALLGSIVVSVVSTALNLIVRD